MFILMWIDHQKQIIDLKGKKKKKQFQIVWLEELCSWISLPLHTVQALVDDTAKVGS